MLTLLLAAGIAGAGPLTTCITFDAPVDARPWHASYVDLREEPNGEDALAILAERVDLACRQECTTMSHCTPTACTTAAGDTVWWTYNESELENPPSSDFTGTLDVAVVPAPSAGLPWTLATLRRIESSGAGGRAWSSGVRWQVTWIGSLHPLWPEDDAFVEREYHGDQVDGWFQYVAWSNASCWWEAYSSWAYASVTMAGTKVTVPASNNDTVCRNNNPAYVHSYINGVFAGLVQPRTWEMPLGSDADGDRWLAELGDCDDTRADVNCDQSEFTHDGMDQDCNGVDGIDHDRDGAYAPFPSDEPTPTEDCDDDDESVYPGAPDVLDNGVDENCDGVDGLAVVDEDTAPATTSDSVDSEHGCSHAPHAPSAFVLLVAAGLLTRRRRTHP